MSTSKTMKVKTEQRIKTGILVILAAALVFGILRDTFTSKHDFSGYVIAGDLAYHHQNIYDHYLNTWPPTFSFLAIPIYLINSINSNVIQFLWLTGFCLCFVLCIKWSYELIYNQPFELNFKQKSDNPNLNTWLFIVPMLLSMRILYEEIVNIQINVYLMTICLFALKMILKDKLWKPSLLIALTVCIKAYTLILLPFFIFRKQYKIAAQLLLGIFIIHAATTLYFGWENTISFYQTWITKDVVAKNELGYGNQSLWSFVTAFISPVERMPGISYNFFSIPPEESKRVITIILGISSLGFLWAFLKSYNFKNAYQWQYLIALSLIPTYSPLAWKYYFVFLLPITVALYPIIKNLKVERYLYYGALGIITFTSPMFIGKYLAQLTASFGAITIASITLSILATHILLTKKYEKISLLGTSTYGVQQPIEK
jgi:hypothetical protein